VINVTYDIQDLMRVMQRLIITYPEAVHLTLDQLGRLGVEKARRRLEERGSIRTGRLHRSITYNTGKWNLNIGTNVPYAPYVEYGTRPHIIRPRRARALRFIIEDQEIYATIVRHPGSWGSNPPPARFLGYALENIRREAISVLKNNILEKWRVVI